VDALSLAGVRSVHRQSLDFDAWHAATHGLNIERKLLARAVGPGCSIGPCMIDEASSSRRAAAYAAPQRQNRTTTRPAGQ
jgi:hypothetical protein